VQEKTIFNVKLESFDAAAKPKIIKEVKSLVPNLTLLEVCIVISMGSSSSS
jgi:large subunit ribosomal protein L7/L12